MREEANTQPLCSSRVKEVPGSNKEEPVVHLPDVELSFPLLAVCQQPKSDSAIRVKRMQREHDWAISHPVKKALALLPYQNMD